MAVVKAAADSPLLPPLSTPTAATTLQRCHTALLILTLPTTAAAAQVIAYMTLGIDVSRLFNEMVMAIETKDLVVSQGRVWIFEMQ